MCFEQVLEKYLTGGFFGEDKEGHPVFYDFLGNLDVKGIVLIIYKKEITYTVVCICVEVKMGSLF